jgi:hypothetical protein
MRPIDSDIIDQLELKEFRPFFLLTMTIDSVAYRYTDCDIPLVFDGNTFTARGFQSGNVSYSTEQIVDRASFKVDDIDQTMKALFVGGSPRGEPVLFELVVLDSNYDVVDDESAVLFQGTIDEWNIDEADLIFTTTSLASQWNQRTLATQSSSCRWKAFKGTECTFVGEPTACDRTFAFCESIGNSANFGGFRWLPSIVESEIVWGRNRSGEGR